MAFRTPLWTAGASHDTDVLRQSTAALLSAPGVCTSADLRVTQRGAGANMSVDVAAGRCGILDRICWSDAIVNLPIGAPPAGGLSRIDSIQAILDDDGSGSGSWEILPVPGTASASPSPPPVPGNAEELAWVLVTSGTASILNAAITDRRRYATATATAPVLPPSGRDGQVITVGSRHWVRRDGAWAELAPVSAHRTTQQWPAPFGLYNQTWGVWGSPVELGAPGRPVTVTGRVDAVLTATASGGAGTLRVETSFDGGATWQPGQELGTPVANPIFGAPLSTSHTRSGTPSGPVQVRVQGQRVSASPVVTAAAGVITATMHPAT